MTNETTDYGASSPGQQPGQSRPIVPKTASEALRPQAGTPPPVRSRRSKSQVVVFLNFMMSAAVLLAIGAFAAVWIGKTTFEGPGPLAVSDTVLIRPNSGVSEIAALLERRGMISDARIFRLGLRVHGNDGRLRAGEYEVKARASMHEIMDLLVSGRSVLHSLTIPEGLTVTQAFRRIAAAEELDGEMPSELPQEGMIAADTIRFTRGMKRQEVIDRLTAQQRELVEGIWQRRSDDLPVEDINEFVTLASIVEKETGRADERSRVASVFINRLRKGMRLQSDPTIIYGIFGGEGKPADRPIYRSDIDTPTPYNTYTINGLPPGPIAIPGRASLEAVANPSQTEDLYFVADGTGGHVFASTLEEHNENVARWRRIERERAAAAGNEATTSE
ncbi:MAG: endolytic transglycosylase MltG [Aquamicrobium sp.]|uniref:endolytic transglycosylase MltG n=1 Tax=Aquamicrobium sp. TaxID=1872579 RepID=UPI00349E5657|nr:endolytic transglycosylase MltG [Aquamicrobium sp.]MCO5157045.1 endolytic transglycosylase MltG [Aquamicrobium sp.]